MAKVAKLVCISLMTRVVVEKDATDEDIVKAARGNFIQKVKEDGLLDHLESIENDEECPFGTFKEDKNYK